MSGKLSGGLSDTSRDALESLVAMGDTSVPGIEASDINDGDIMANTRERVNANGQFQFVYIPPDGSDPIESDWISQDHKKKVILGWCEGVKGAIISRGQAGMQAANEAAMEAKLKAKRAEDMGDAELDAVIPEVVAPTSARQAVRTPDTRSDTPRLAANVATDPTVYITEQLEIAQERLNAAENTQKDILMEVMAARRDVRKWTALAEAITGVGDNDDPRPSVSRRETESRNAGSTKPGAIIVPTSTAKAIASR